MHNFEYKNPTKLIFGTHQIATLAGELGAIGAKSVMLVYGGGSIKRNGTYDEVVAELQRAGIDYVDFAGVEPNPRLDTVKRGVALAREHEVDALLAVGGGSVIDCTKLISAAIPYAGDPWDIVTRQHVPERAVPFGTVLTLAATGSEMNSGSVITNWETQEKYGWGHPLVYPTFSILDPRYTLTVPKDQTIYGIVDMMSHCFEQYFHPNEAPVQERMTEGVLKAIVEYGPKLVDDLDNVEYRSIILFAGTMALNGVLQMGALGDWASHNIEHAVSAVHDIPHAGGLAILFPRWMEHVLDETNASRFARLGEEVFGVVRNGRDDETVARETIQAIRTFFDELGAPNRLADYGIDESSFEAMLNSAMKRGALGRFKVLERGDVEAILQLSK